MVVFLIPVAVVGYKIWEKRRQEQEEERLKQQSETPDKTTSSCPDETDSDVISSIAVDSSLPESSTSSVPSTMSEKATFTSRQNALLRSWKANASEIRASLIRGNATSSDNNSYLALSQDVDTSFPQSSLSRDNHGISRSCGAGASETVLMEESSSHSRACHDILDLSTESHAADMQMSRLPSWVQHPSEESTAIVSPVASS